MLNNDASSENDDDHEQQGSLFARRLQSMSRQQWRPGKFGSCQVWTVFGLPFILFYKRAGLGQSPLVSIDCCQIHAITRKLVIHTSSGRQAVGRALSKYDLLGLHAPGDRHIHAKTASLGYLRYIVVQIFLASQVNVEQV